MWKANIGKLMHALNAFKGSKPLFETDEMLMVKGVCRDEEFDKYGSIKEDLTKKLENEGFEVVNDVEDIDKFVSRINEILKENMSMQAIRTWLELHPQRMDEVLHHNKSFVFFQKEKDGPYGSTGVKVTPLRSIATDRRLFPEGALCFMQAQLPDKININPLKTWEKACFFVMNQDTGGAIKGPARADLFCGNGNYARFTAGHMNTYGTLFFLVLNPFLYIKSSNCLIE